jgi:UDP-N-acetylmuramate--alanine ligase
MMKRIHFVGVSGIGMSAAAEISMASGFTVSGSALEENEQTRRLVGQGLTFFRGHNGAHVRGSEAVVVSAAVPEHNVELVEAKKLGIPVHLYAEYLGMLMADKRGIAVAGTHGKTTTTAMMATIVQHAGLSPTVVCGGVMSEYGSNALVGSGDLFIAEACEYNRSFLHLPKRYAIVTNIEAEHLDYYSGIEEIEEVFRIFMESTDEQGFVCVNGDDVHIRRIVHAIDDRITLMTVGRETHNRYGVESHLLETGGYRFQLHGAICRGFSVDLPVPGAFNVINASLAAVCAMNIGIDAQTVGEALGQFKGSSRRLELLKHSGETLIYSDYAHHPTEIRVSLQALRERHPGKAITLVFQPHQYSRTSYFFHEFAEVLKLADRLILTEVYRQRDKPGSDFSVNSAALFREIEPHMRGRIALLDDRSTIQTSLQEENLPDGITLFMGAGDIDAVARAYAASR